MCARPDSGMSVSGRTYAQLEGSGSPSREAGPRLSRHDRERHTGSGSRTASAVLPDTAAGWSTIASLANEVWSRSSTWLLGHWYCDSLALPRGMPGMHPRARAPPLGGGPTSEPLIDPKESTSKGDVV